MTNNIRYRGGVQPIAEYKNEVAKHRDNADRDYDGQYRGAAFHHDQGQDAREHDKAQHEAKVCYRGAKATVLVG